MIVARRVPCGSVVSHFQNLGVCKSDIEPKQKGFVANYKTSPLRASMFTGCFCNSRYFNEENRTKCDT